MGGKGCIEGWDLMWLGMLVVGGCISFGEFVERGKGKRLGGGRKEGGAKEEKERRS